MKRMVALSAVIVLVGFALILPTLAEGPDKKKSKNPQLGKLRHVVMFQFKKDTPPGRIKQLEETFRALPSKIPTIVGFEWGMNNSTEGFSQGLTHCFLLTFNDVKGREVYLPHPEHKKYVEILMPHLEKVVVVDYIVQE